MGSKTSKSIPLASYISDLEGGPLTLSGTVSLSGSTPVAIPVGIMSWSAVNTLVIASSSSADIGTYTITLTAKDS
jgi:hypothetical protein